MIWVLILTLFSSFSFADNNVCTLPKSSPFLENFAEQFISYQHTNCPLFKEEKDFDHNQKGLSDYWAQEYVGTDLLRNLLIEKKLVLNDENKLFDVLDNGDFNHGINVSSMIAGPTESSLIPATNLKMYVGDESRFHDYYGTNFDSSFPPYINNSQEWNIEDQAIVFKWIAKNYGSLIVTSADNNGGSLEIGKIKEDAAKNLSVLVVGSISPTGEPSSFSQHSDQVVISAPSDHFLLSSGKSKFAVFGGTSGATPQVTAALSAFTLITGHKLTKDEAIRLLKGTAQKGSKSFEGRHGAGTLNTYKIGRIAFKMNEKCSEIEISKKEKCITDLLSDNESYVFPYEDISEAKRAFAECFPGTQQSEASCEDRQKLVKLLRAKALLNPNKEVLQGLACISKIQGYPQNSAFYESLYIQND